MLGEHYEREMQSDLEISFCQKVMAYVCCLPTRQLEHPDQQVVGHQCGATHYGMHARSSLLAETSSPYQAPTGLPLHPSNFRTPFGRTLTSSEEYSEGHTPESSPRLADNDRAMLLPVSALRSSPSSNAKKMVQSHGTNELLRRNVSLMAATGSGHHRTGSEPYPSGHHPSKHQQLVDGVPALGHRRTGSGGNLPGMGNKPQKVLLAREVLGLHQVCLHQTNSEPLKYMSNAALGVPMDLPATGLQIVGGDSKKLARSDSAGRMEQKWKGEKWKGDAKHENEVVLDLDDEDCCPTCLEDYDDSNPKILTDCNHNFHLSCIYEWMERSNKCPVCSSEMHFADMDA